MESGDFLQQKSLISVKGSERGAVKGCENSVATIFVVVMAIKAFTST